MGYFLGGGGGERALILMVQVAQLGQKSKDKENVGAGTACQTKGRCHDHPISDIC